MALCQTTSRSALHWLKEAALGRALFRTKLAVGHPTSYRPEFCDRIVELMAEGRSLVGCALLLGVHPDSLYEWQQRYPEFFRAVKAGRAASTTFWEDRLLEIAEGGPGNFQAIQWALRNRSWAPSGWHHDREKIEPPDANGGPPQTPYDLDLLTHEDLVDLERLLLKASGGSSPVGGGQMSSG